MSCKEACKCGGNDSDYFNVLQVKSEWVTGRASHLIASAEISSMLLIILTNVSDENWMASREAGHILNNNSVISYSVGGFVNVMRRSILLFYMESYIF